MPTCIKYNLLRSKKKKRKKNNVCVQRGRRERKTLNVVVII